MYVCIYIYIYTCINVSPPYAVPDKSKKKFPDRVTYAAYILYVSNSPIILSFTRVKN